VQAGQNDHQVCKQVKMADDELLQQQQKQQQQQQQQLGKPELVCVERDSIDSMINRAWLAAFVQLIGLLAQLRSSERVRAEWRQLAKPTASLLEHAMHVLAREVPHDADCSVLRTGVWQVVQHAPG
jgi:hypothetical protein